PPAREAGPPARRRGLRRGAGAATAALAGDRPDLGRAGEGTRQRLGRVSLVRGADPLLAAFVRPTAASTGPAHRDPRGVPPSGLCPDLSEVLEPISSLFPNALTAGTSLRHWQQTY